MAALLRADLDLVLELGGNNIYSHEAPSDKPSSGKWVVVRERIESGDIAETQSGLVWPTIQVMTECRDTISSPRTVHGTLQDHIARALIGATPSVNKSTFAENIRRTVRPSAVAYDADDASYFSTSAFRCGLAPVYN